MSHIVIQDPADLSARFSNKNRLGFDGELSIEELIDQELQPLEAEDLSFDDQKEDLFSKIEKYLPRIPEREADIISLYHKDKMKQEQIARIFDITQAAVSYRLHKGIKRIQFLRTIPELEKEKFEIELGPKFSDQDREILWRMYLTTCQSEIAKQMNLTQGRVRHRFFRSLNKIKSLIQEEVREKQMVMKIEAEKNNSVIDIEYFHSEIENVTRRSKFSKYYTVFFAISDKHFNILHEVSLPQFKNRGDAQILPIG